MKCLFNKNLRSISRLEIIRPGTLINPTKTKITNKEIANIL